MEKLEKKSLDSPDETRKMEHGTLALATVGGLTFGRAVFQPGWKWSQDVKPMVKTDSCQFLHKQYVESGKMHVVMDDGTEMDFEAGDVGVIPPGHDAWIVGDEPCVAIGVDVVGGDTNMTDYAVDSAEKSEE